MKVVYLTHSFKPYIGGVQYVVEQVSREIAKKGYEVEVLTLAPPFSSLPKVEEMDGYTLKRFPGLNPSNAYYVPTPSFVKALLELQADVVHAHVVHSLVPLVSYMVKKFKPQWERLIITPHFHDMGFSWHTDIAWLFYRPLLGKLFRSADIIHSISPYEASLIKRRFNIDPVVIPHGISEDVLSYKWKPEGFTIAYSGKLLRYKRVDLLLESMSLLNKRVPEAKTVIIGGGPESSRLERMANELKVNAKFIPPLSRKEYLKCLASSSVLCYLSESEAFCITALEALAIGLPTVVVEPWGNTFRQYSRAIILPSCPTPADVCKALVSLKNRTFSSSDEVSTWSEVANDLEKIYKSLGCTRTGNVNVLQKNVYKNHLI